MNLSMTSDYVTGLGSPEPYLRDIAEAGFTYVHWCHQWDTDFVYMRPEIEQIDRWMREVGLQLLDLHGSAGVEKVWHSRVEYVRLAGVELVANRLEMTARLGGGVVIMHLPTAPADPAEAAPYWTAVRRSLDALSPVSRATGVCIALENLGVGHMATVAQVLAQYPPDFVGLCYDSGHGNKSHEGLEWLERLKDRLISVHLHDNDGMTDQHKPLFSGTIDWDRLASIMAASSYQKPVSQELQIRESGLDEKTLLSQAYANGQRLTGLIAAHRQSSRPT